MSRAEVRLFYLFIYCFIVVCVLFVFLYWVFKVKVFNKKQKTPDLISTSQPELLDILLVFKSQKPITYFHLQNRFPFSPPKETEFAKVIFAHV